MEKFQCKSKRVISIGEQQVGNDLFMVIDFALNDTGVNLNEVQYSPNFLLDISEKSSDYAGLPLKVDLKKLLNGNTTALTHNYIPSTGKFYNQMIGSFCKFYTIGKGETLELCGTVKIPKEFAEACDVIQELYDSDALFVSYEIIVGKYIAINNGKVKYVNKDLENYLCAYSIVSQPAVVSAKAMKLCAELIRKGGETLVTGKTEYTKEQFIADFKKNLAIKDIAELNYDQVMKNLYSQLKEGLGDNYWDFYICDNGVDFLIMESCSDGNLMRIDFSVDGDAVVILDCYPVTKSYNNIAQNDEGGNNMAKTVAELELEVANLKIDIAAKDAKLKEKDTEIDTNKKNSKAKDTKNEEDKKVEDKKKKETDTKTAEIKKQLTTLSESLISKDAEIAELLPIKQAYETAKAAKVEEKLVADRIALKEKFSKLLSAEIISEPEIAEAIEKLDMSLLNSKVVEIAMAKAGDIKPIVETASRITDSTKFSGVDAGSLREKYSI